MQWDDYIKRAEDTRFEKDIEAWARWVHDPAGTGSVVQLGYGKGAHQRVIDGPPTGKRAAGPAVMQVEEHIERLLWTYQDMDGFSKRARHVAAFRLKYTTRMTDYDASDEIKVSIATYKRYVSNVKAYLKSHLYEK